MNRILTFIFFFAFIGCAPLMQPNSQLASPPKLPMDQVSVERPQESTKKLFDLNDIPAVPVQYKSKVLPVYPETARAAKKGGKVVIQLTVDKNGLPKDIKPVTSLGYGLEECLIEAIQKTTFYPAKYGRNPIDKRIEVTYSFAYETTEE